MLHQSLIAFVLILGFFLNISFAEVPTVLIYQGRLLDHSTLKPPEGSLGQALDFRVLIRRVSQPSPSVPPLLNQVLTGVVVQDGLFTLPIDISQGAQGVLTFDEPYFLEVLIGDSRNGGKIGQQSFRTVPYAFGSQNSLQLNSLEPESYSVITHNLTELKAASFVIDKSAEAKANEDQLIIKNDSSGTSRDVFVVDEDGNLKSVRNLSLTSFVESSDSLDIRRVNSKAVEVSVIKATNNGDFIAMDPEFPGKLSVGGTLRVSGILSIPNSFTDAQKSTHTVEIQGETILRELLQFTSGSSIEVLGTTNPVGFSHILEDHLQTENSTMLSRLVTLTSNVNVDSSFHTHVLQNGEVNDFNPDAVDGIHIADGSLQNIDFQDAIAASLIEDTKLAAISTAGKVALSAVPPDVVRTDIDNDFTRVFPQTLNSFDRLKSKGLTIRSTRSDTNVNAFPLFEALADDEVSFEYRILSNGDLTYISRKSSPIATFGIINGANKDDDLQFRTQNIEFTDLDGGTSLSYFSGSMVQDGTIEGADLANGAVDQNLLKNFDVSDPVAGVGTLNFSTSAVSEDKLLGSLTSRVFSGNPAPAVTAGKIEAGTLQSAAFGSGSVLTTDLADGAVAFDDFASGSVTDDDLEDGSVTTDKFFEGLSVSDLVQGEDFGSDAVSSDKLSTLTGSLIEGEQLAAEVLRTRALPMKITTSVSEVITLSNLNALNPMKFLQLEVVNFSSDSNYSAAVEFLDSNDERVFSLNNNGTISMSISTGSIIPVTLEPPLMAAWFRTTDSDSNCGLKDSRMEPLVGSGSDLRSDCISKTANHGFGVPLAYKEAMMVCQSQGYQLCDVNQAVMSCSQQKLSTGESLLLRNLAEPSTAMTFRVLDGTCNSSGDFDFVSVHATNDTTGFRCCLK